MRKKETEKTVSVLSSCEAFLLTHTHSIKHSKLRNSDFFGVFHVVLSIYKKRTCKKNTTNKPFIFSERSILFCYRRNPFTPKHKHPKRILEQRKIRFISFISSLSVLLFLFVFDVEKEDKVEETTSKRIMLGIVKTIPYLIPK